MSNTIEFSPAIPWPVPFDVQKRIEELCGYLDSKNPQYERKEQHVNIRAAIKLYEGGKIDGSQDVCIMEGKVVTKEEMDKRTTWVEGTRRQLAQEFAYGYGPFGLRFHEIRMLVRLTPQRGGDETVHGISAMNGTGSEILTLFNTDILACV